MSAAPTIDAKSELASWGARCAAAIGLVAAFWFVGHSLDYSEIVAAETALGPDRAENRFVAQQAETTTSSAVGYLLLAGLGVAWWATAPRRRLTWNTGLLLLCVVYVGWCLITVLWSIDAMQSFRKTAIVALMLVAAFGAAARFELEDLAWILLLAALAFIGAGVLAEAAHGHFRPWRSDYRFSGTVHPNDQSVQCALVALAAAFVPFGRVDRPWLRRALVILALAGLWFTKSRTTLAAFLFAAAVGMVLRTRGVQRWLVLSGCLTLACLGAAAYSFVSVAALDETADVTAMGRRQDVGTLTGRLPLWEELWDAAAERPWLGYGYASFWNSRTIQDYSERFAWHIPHGHNAYLDLALNVGVVGLAFYVLWFGAAAAACAARYEYTGRRGALWAACLCAFAAVHGLAESKFPGVGLGGFALVTAMTTIAVRRTADAEGLAPALAAGDRRRFAPRASRRYDNAAPRGALAR